MEADTEKVVNMLAGRKRLSPGQLQAYERARAAHTNCLENMPIFFSAIILGNIAKVPLKVTGGMN